MSTIISRCEHKLGKSEEKNRKFFVSIFSQLQNLFFYHFLLVQTQLL
jgi:hypothetical protein